MMMRIMERMIQSTAHWIKEDDGTQVMNLLMILITLINMVRMILCGNGDDDNEDYDDDFDDEGNNVKFHLISWGAY